MGGCSANHNRPKRHDLYTDTTPPVSESPDAIAIVSVMSTSSVLIAPTDYNVSGPRYTLLLTTDSDDIHAVQRLRYDVFHRAGIRVAKQRPHRRRPLRRTLRPSHPPR